MSPDHPTTLRMRIVEGSNRVLAECPDIGVSVSARTEEIATRNLEDMISSHCRTLLRRNGTSGVPDETVNLARTIVAKGFVLSRFQ